MENKDFEMIKDSLPSEGNAIVVMRQNGKLKTAGITLSITKNQGSIEDDRVLGELLYLNNRLAELGLGCGVFSVMVALAGAGLWYHNPKVEWYGYLGAIIAAAILYFFMDEGYASTRRKLFFHTEGISIISKACSALQINEHELLAKISRTDKLDQVEKHLSLYLNKTM